MIVSAIVATAQNGVIGKDNQIPWYLPADLKYFKQITLHHHIIMGRKCFESIGNPLPKRTNIVITRNPFWSVTNGLVAHTIEEALNIAFDNGEDEVFIIGGGEIYQQSLLYWDKIYWTQVDIAVSGDVFFPEINLSEWKLLNKECHQADDKNEFDYCFNVFERK
ncbi:MAG: dihydrofolate reductase [Saprospiraceae bacterium]|nr:dihydrofolate reductase [Saprospiraceae bacterium]MBP7699554.1 dihydrofolate reductase [Saprospiraceae bacterium]